MAKTCLLIAEQGGFPVFTRELRAAGFEAEVVNSMRKGLAWLKKHSAEVVVAEFIYSPRYGVLISNLEPLLALLQTRAPNTRVIVLCDKQRVEHLDKLREQYQIDAVVYFPVRSENLCAALDERRQST